MFNIASTLQTCGSAAQCGWFAHEALRSLRSRFPTSHHLVQRVVCFIEMTSSRYGVSAIQPMSAPAADHLRIGRLVCLRDLSAHALNGSQGIVFGPERSGHVPVHLLGLCEDDGCGDIVDRMVPVGILTEMGLPPALGCVECKSPVSYFCARHSIHPSNVMQQVAAAPSSSHTLLTISVVSIIVLGVIVLLRRR